MKKTYLLPIAFICMLATTCVPRGMCYPPHGVDQMNGTTAVITLQTVMFTETITATGPTTVNRTSDEYNPGDGHWMIDTEIISMSLTGVSLYIGPITIVESPSPTRRSTGAIRQINAGQDFPATSFFDVFVEIHTILPPNASVLYNDIPAHMSTSISSIPPWGSNYTGPPTPVPLKDQGGNIIGNLTHVVHMIPPIAGGLAFPVDKLSLLAPYIGLTSTIAGAAVATSIYAKRAKRKK